MPILMRLATSLLSILLLTSPGFVPTGARTVRHGVDAKPALWVVKDADTTVYLFGTIHVLKPGVHWFGGPVKRAFDKSQTLVVEVVTGDQAEVARTTARLALDPGGTPLTQKLDAETRTRYLALLDEMGLPAARLEGTRPWFAAVTLSILPLEKLGYDPDAGVDHILQAKATATGKQTMPLERVDEQLGYFAALPEPVQIAFLKATIGDAEKAETEIGRMVSEWSAGKPAALADDMNDSLKDMPEIAEALLYQRNRHWADWIKGRMAQPGTVFVAVGAGHLAGAGSVIDELAKRGLMVKRVE